MSNESAPQSSQSQFSEEVRDLHAASVNNPDVYTSAERMAEGKYVSGHKVVNTGDNMVGEQYSVHSGFSPDEQYTNKLTQSARTDTQAGSYQTKVVDGITVAPDERGATTSVTRMENGKEVTREIKDPKAHDLVEKLALKKLHQSIDADTDTKAA